MNDTTFTYDELSETAKSTAYSEWLRLQDATWDTDCNNDTSRYFFEKEHSNDCRYYATGEFYLTL